ncbi:hypothetical protein E2C01_043752 [Portunus trituberculatus]|uniref:Uncharacterized protein n=1 Tax=Portunus trituberculatus TaxID=210409 RepID=A0A5B7FWY6_PORTR|nr:hypothetical protein [Portunus trituberculatus]
MWAQNDGQRITPNNTPHSHKIARSLVRQTTQKGGGSGTDKAVGRWCLGQEEEPSSLTHSARRAERGAHEDLARCSSPER